MRSQTRSEDQEVEEEGWEGTERLVGREKTEKQACHVDAGTLREREVPTRPAEGAQPAAPPHPTLPLSHGLAVSSS